MRAYRDWDGVGSFVTKFEQFGSEFFNEPSDRRTYVEAAELAETGRLAELQIGFSNATLMKGLADAYFRER